jgi:hypothetical protein
MSFNRRKIMGLAGLAAAAAVAPGTAAAQAAPAPKTAASVEAALVARALQNLHPIRFDGRAFSGAR